MNGEAASGTAWETGSGFGALSLEKTILPHFAAQGAFPGGWSVESDPVDVTRGGGLTRPTHSGFAGTISVGTVALRTMPSATLPSSSEAITPWPWDPSTTMSAPHSFT